MQHQDYTSFFVRIAIVSEVSRKLELVITPKRVLIEEHCETPKINHPVNNHMLRSQSMGKLRDFPNKFHVLLYYNH